MRPAYVDYTFPALLVAFLLVFVPYGFIASALIVGWIGLSYLFSL